MLDGGVVVTIVMVVPWRTHVEYATQYQVSKFHLLSMNERLLNAFATFGKISPRLFTHLTYQSDKNPLNDLSRQFSTGRLRSSDLKIRFAREKLFLKIFLLFFAA